MFVLNPVAVRWNMKQQFRAEPVSRKDGLSGVTTEAPIRPMSPSRNTPPFPSYTRSVTSPQYLDGERYGTSLLGELVAVSNSHQAAWTLDGNIRFRNFRIVSPIFAMMGSRNVQYQRSELQHWDRRACQRMRH
jgi:hypothetical protein